MSEEAARAIILQIPVEDIQKPLEPISNWSSGLRDILEEYFGITFTEETEDRGQPGPYQYALILLEPDGSQYWLEHHYDHPEDFIAVYADTRNQSAHLATDELIQALAPHEASGLVTWFAND